MAEIPEHHRGWRVGVRRGKHGGYVGTAAVAGREPIATAEHRGRGARERAARDIMAQVEIAEMIGGEGGRMSERKSIGIGDAVKWVVGYDNSTEFGSVAEIVGSRARVIYGPWGDEFWAPLDRLTTASPGDGRGE